MHLGLPNRLRVSRLSASPSDTTSRWCPRLVFTGCISTPVEGLSPSRKWVFQVIQSRVYHRYRAPAFNDSFSVESLHKVRLPVAQKRAWRSKLFFNKKWLAKWIKNTSINPVAKKVLILKFLLILSSDFSKLPHNGQRALSENFHPHHIQRRADNNISLK